MRRLAEDITVNDWLDKHLKLLKGRKVRIIDTATGRSAGDTIMLYINKKVLSTKVTSRFLFIFV